MGDTGFLFEVNVIIVGIDPSLTHSALAWMDGDKLEERSVLSKAQDDELVRLENVLVRIMKFHLEVDESNPRYAVVEGIAFGAKGRALFQLGWLAFALRMSLRHRGWHIIDVPPTTLKSFVCGKGNAPKELVIRDVFKRWGYSASDNNAADAYGLMKLGQCYLSVNKTQAEAKLLSKLSIISPLV